MLQVARRAGERRPDVDGPVGEPDVQRVAVGGRVHGDGLDPELAAGADDADRDLAAVGDQDAARTRRRRAFVTARNAPARSARHACAFSAIRSKAGGG